MSIVTSATRMWLTRSFKPFTFLATYENTLPYEECEKLGLYIHIPFCASLCNFCPYCKTLYDKAKMNRYIDALIKEIHLVAQQEKKDVTSLYFGGGTPALAKDRLKEIIEAVQEHFIIHDGIGLELHPDNVDVDTLLALKEAGVTKISIGIQSFNGKFQRILGRKPVDPEKLKNALMAVPFATVSMDFIFALPGQSCDDLKEDIELAFSHGANHIAIYPFIDFTFTQSPLKAMPKRQKKKLLDDITEYCEQQGYTRSSIWTFSNDPFASYSSMTRETFLGMGCSAATLLRNVFKINTFDIDSYITRIDNNHLPTSLTLSFSLRQRMVYWLFWTAYSTQVDEKDFAHYFHVPLKKAYGFELVVAKMLGFIKEDDGVYRLTHKGAFYYHYYENFYTLSYIDKMWGIMRKEAFPSKMTF